jgi:mannosyltransferase
MINFLKREKHIALLALLLTLNLVIKGIFLSSNSLAGDEPFSVYHAQMDIMSIIHILSEGNNPPLYEIFLHFWIDAFGISELAVRMPSLIFSCLTLLFIYKIGIRYLNDRIAIYSSLLFIFSNYHILFSHESRVYSLLGLLTVMSMYYFMWILNYCSNDSIRVETSTYKLRKNIGAITILNSLIIYSHYFGFFVLLVQFIFFISNRKRIAEYWKHFLICISIIAIVYLPNIHIILSRFLESSTQGTWIKPPNGLDSFYNMLRQLCNAPVVTVCVIALLIFSMVKFIITKKENVENSLHVRLVILWVSFIIVVMFTVSFRIPMFIDRYLMPAAVAFCLVLGIALNYINPMRKLPHLFPAIFIILFAASAKPNITNKRNISETVHFIKEIQDTNTLVIICPPELLLNFAYYYDKDIFKNYNTENIYLNIKQSLGSNNIHAVFNIAEIDYRKWRHIIYLDADASFSYPDNNIIQSLEKDYQLNKKTHFKEIFNVYEYSLDAGTSR